MLSFASAQSPNSVSVSSRCEELCLEIDEALWHWLRGVVPNGPCCTVLICIFTVCYGAYNAATLSLQIAPAAFLRVVLSLFVLEYLWEYRRCWFSWFMVYMNSEPQQAKREKFNDAQKSGEKLWRVTYACLRLTFCRLYGAFFGWPNHESSDFISLSPNCWGHGHFYSYGGPEHFLQSTAAWEATKYSSWMPHWAVPPARFVKHFLAYGTSTLGPTWSGHKYIATRSITKVA